ncbi:MAG: AbrB/MazE/SpoVT family DNA-binding domain-containing protein [Alistipes sp.]|jgi:AbrB family looped-hinge helix DNA binding protein|nr:AbrB/MazE/SpoVT family DNA-binding domain-containing protein [Alistipes sp.]MBQ3581634.1 AbrB/MazE/SpoVT family DNA-binding domain-containing protein [Alistipes sp.]MBQ5921760.1 AbrB/MazE/SpoVT family DNA-binding domain-containing protein [Alistipes sp.]MBQ8438332.1 AbrB/MazE/SpoVT family DNA-binding domain-containing protein [Alistipes sp.]MBQ8552701.1 AbrB/MazE/SpoVT family DNA-binding domain-containing protein [Alistipes sp.]
MQEKDGKYIFGVVKISEKGQIVIPKEARKLYDLKAGDALLLLGDKNGMAMVKTEIFQDLVGQVLEDLNK